MESKPSKFLVGIIIFNLLISIIAISGLVFLLLLAPKNTTITSTTVSSSTSILSSVVSSANKIAMPTTYSPDVNFKFTLDNLPRIDGSTSNVPLRSFMLCKLLNYPCSWQEYTLDEVGANKERYVDIKTTDANNKVLGTKSVNSTTHNAYVKLINGDTDVIFVATLPSDEEKALMKEKNVEFNIQPIAMDAFVFIDNVKNPVTGLTLKQILDVYTGQVTNWKELGGSNAKLNAYQREDNSGSQELMKSLVLKGVKAMGAPEMVIQGMMGLINRVEGDVNSIGYSVYFYEQFMVKNSSLKLLAIDGVAPSYSTLADQTYPLVSPVYVVTKKGIAANSPASNLANWMLTKEGQTVVKDSGYVPAVKQ